MTKFLSRFPILRSIIAFFSRTSLRQAQAQAAEPIGSEVLPVIQSYLEQAVSDVKKSEIYLMLVATLGHTPQLYNRMGFYLQEEHNNNRRRRSGIYRTRRGYYGLRERLYQTGNKTEPIAAPAVAEVELPQGTPAEQSNLFDSNVAVASPVTMPETQDTHDKFGVAGSRNYIKLAEEVLEEFGEPLSAPFVWVRLQARGKVDPSCQESFYGTIRNHLKTNNSRFVQLPGGKLACKSWLGTGKIDGNRNFTREAVAGAY